MTYLPPGVSDVNAEPKRLGQNTALSAWLTSASEDEIFDVGNYALFLKNRYRPRINHRVFFYGADGYIGSNVRAVLKRVGIDTFNIENIESPTPNNDDVLIHLACPRKIQMINGGDTPHLLKTCITRWLELAERAVFKNFQIDRGNILYFASQCVYNEPANDPYSLMKRAGARLYNNRGDTVLYPGTVFGRFNFYRMRTDTVLNKLAFRQSKSKEIYTSAAVRSFITLHEIVEAVLCFAMGLSVEPFQCYNIGRAALVEIVDPNCEYQHLNHDTGTSLANFFPYTRKETLDLYRSYYRHFVKFLEM